MFHDSGAKQRGRSPMAFHMRFRIVIAFVVLTILVGVLSASLWRASEYGVDFFAYYVAACLVRGNQSAHIYDVVDRDTNPQLLMAGSKTVFAQTARAHGIPQTVLYIYPPMLADLIVSLTRVRPSVALKIWHALELLMIGGLSIILTRMLKLKFRGSAALIAIGILLFRPTLSTIHWGQASIFLLFIMTAGFALYVHGQKNVAALLFALAVAVKLEPIIIVVPIIAWRDWKLLRMLVMWGILLCVVLWAVNGGYALNLYFFHQLPAMSAGSLGGAAFYGNRSVGNIFYTFLDGAHPLISSSGSAWIVRSITVLILGYAGWLSRFEASESSRDGQRFETGMIFLLLICCLSPYSWFYNWALSAPAAIMFCKRAWEGRAGTIETTLLIMLLLALSTSRFNMPMITPLVGIALALVGLQQIKLERRGIEAHYRTALERPWPYKAMHRTGKEISDVPAEPLCNFHGEPFIPGVSFLSQEQIHLEVL